MKAQSGLHSFLVLGIFTTIIMIVIVMIIGFYGNNEDDSSDGETSAGKRGNVIESSECIINSDCVDQFGEGYICFLKKCYAPAEENIESFKGTETPAELTGFFSNFFTGNAISEEAGDVIYYNDGWIGIGTTAPNNKLQVSGGNISADSFCIGASCISSWSSSGSSLWSNSTAGNVYLSSGKVGIGTTAPNNKLQVSGGNISADSFCIGASCISSWIFNGIFYNNGNVGIGTTAPSVPLDVVTTKNTEGIRTQGSVDNVAIVLKNTGTGGREWKLLSSSGNSHLGQGKFAIQDHSAFADRLIIDTNGYVGISRTPTTNMLEVEGTASKSVAGDWLSNSDKRIKTDVQTVKNAISTIMNLNPVMFRYDEEYLKQHPAIENKSYYNFIAQEFQGIFPDFVKGSGEFLPDGSEILQLDSYPAQVVAIKAIQEQQMQIEKLQEENNAMKQSLCSLGVSHWC
ncbi:MAG: tail fiber domain-containing protein [Nanoarchaeota archaeon]|nr:tail fiber domain-containing protein [Nanoarchaeota archaeon]